MTQDVGVKCVVAKFVLSPEQKEHHAAIPNDLIQITTNEPDFLKKVITGDDSWVCNYDSENGQLSQWKSPGSPCPKKAWQRCKKIETMLTDF